MRVCVCACVFGQWKDHETHLRQMSESDKPPLISKRDSFEERRVRAGGSKSERQTNSDNNRL